MQERLIDATALIKKLQAERDPMGGESWVNYGEIIRGMPTISPRPGWTPCAEGLPTVKETVLATIADGFGNDIMFAWYDGENWKDGYKNKIPVIAWQHLPTPYRADDTTGKVKEDEFMREAMYDQLHSNGN